MEFYHVLNRGVEKRDVVVDDGDRMRFVKSLYVFNDSSSAPNAITQPSYWDKTPAVRDKLVHIHCWCLMNNHYHLLLSPVDDNLHKLSMYMKKLNMGYAKFFNEKYERSGYLWQGKYKKSYVGQDAYFQYIPFYIHLNPLDYSHPEWREGKVKHPEAAFAELQKYRWSSYYDYIKQKNFPSILDSDILKDVLGSPGDQFDAIRMIISDTKLAKESERIET